MHHHIQIEGTAFEPTVTILLITAFLLYLIAAIITSRKYKIWPIYRYFFWGLGLFCVALSLVGPLAAFAHTNFVGHMFGHLLLGMLAPLLLLLATPMTLLLRSLKVKNARRITGVLKSRPIQFINNPVTASILNIGGLYVLYTTDLYLFMHQSLFFYMLIHLHVFLAGYLFTISIIYIDITPHRYSHLYRAIVLVLALAGHKVLSKHIYATPPSSVPRIEAEIGSMWMYYGGDVVDLSLIIILCYQWYKATAPRTIKHAN
ncbi:cytochrome c oxidase assembly protein [Staphylococcus equorum]|uniref:cytochrome c oxidase assembly protein n=1 Tax=Staphylococcus equorum TaxID=246432 RepID=UPI0039B0A595